MPLWTSSEAIKATGGSCSVVWKAEGISIDTRTIMTGDQIGRASCRERV